MNSYVSPAKSAHSLGHPGAMQACVVTRARHVPWKDTKGHGTRHSQTPSSLLAMKPTPLLHTLPPNSLLTCWATVPFLSSKTTTDTARWRYIVIAPLTLSGLISPPVFCQPKINSAPWKQSCSLAPASRGRASNRSLKTTFQMTKHLQRRPHRPIQPLTLQMSRCGRKRPELSILSLVLSSSSYASSSSSICSSACEASGRRTPAHIPELMRLKHARMLLALLPPIPVGLVTTQTPTINIRILMTDPENRLLLTTS